MNPLLVWVGFALFGLLASLHDVLNHRHMMIYCTRREALMFGVGYLIMFSWSMLWL